MQLYSCPILSYLYTAKWAVYYTFYCQGIGSMKMLPKCSRHFQNKMGDVFKKLINSCRKYWNVQVVMNIYACGPLQATVWLIKSGSKLDLRVEKLSKLTAGKLQVQILIKKKKKNNLEALFWYINQNSSILFLLPLNLQLEWNLSVNGTCITWMHENIHKLWLYDETLIL